MYLNKRDVLRLSDTIFWLFILLCAHIFKFSNVYGMPNMLSSVDLFLYMCVRWQKKQEKWLR